MFKTDSPLKHFKFFPFKTAPSNLNLDQKYFSLSNRTGVIEKEEVVGQWKVWLHGYPPHQPSASASITSVSSVNIFVH
jgi:hypothetical protein